MQPNEWKKYFMKELVSFARANRINFNKNIIISKSDHKKSIGYIYIAVSQYNGQVFIGQHQLNSYDFTSIVRRNILLNARKKNTRKDFSYHVLEFADSQALLNQLESEYITMAKEIFGDKCMNIYVRLITKEP